MTLDRQLPVAGATDLLWSGYREYRDAFEAITRRAGRHFENSDWPAMRADTLERLDLYEKIVDRSRQQIERALGASALHRPTWAAIKSAYAQKAGGDPESELACTFYNSVNRRVLDTTGVEQQLEFIAPCPSGPDSDGTGTISYRFSAAGPPAELLMRIVSDYGFQRPFIHLAHDCDLAAGRLAHLDLGPDRTGELQMLPAPFFRDTQAYLIGRIRNRGRLIPVVFSLGSTGSGLYLDAVLQT
ncbi:MAG: bifunctional isocitrate dehydrogenase kinase/phosphatase, partial [Desulfosarcinaceae bacterium]